MNAHLQPSFGTSIAGTSEELRAAQRLRYDVFVTELGGNGPLVDHHNRLELDKYDQHAAHLLLFDYTRPAGDQVIGVYRLMTADMARGAGGFYCESEYDLTLLHNSGLRLLELGRSCLHPDYRGGSGMLHLWSALAEYVDRHKIDALFGVASFHGTDIASFREPLSLLHHRHLAPPKLRVTAKGKTAQSMDMLPEGAIDRVAAMRAIPSLIKAYLRLGGTVGDGVFVDHDFNTTDICLILQRDAIGALQRRIYAKDGGRG